MEEQMRQPTSRAGLLRLIRAAHSAFEDGIDGLTDAQMATPGTEVAWSVKDIAAHLMYWEQRAIFYLECARDGWQPEKDRWIMPRGDAYHALNEENYQAQRYRPLSGILAELRAPQAAMMRLVEATAETDLVTKGRFDWLPDRALIEMVGNETWQHYQDHSESLRSCRAKQA
jgi:hypothetical protein